MLYTLPDVSRFRRAPSDMRDAYPSYIFASATLSAAGEEALVEARGSQNTSNSSSLAKPTQALDQTHVSGVSSETTRPGVRLNFSTEPL